MAENERRFGNDRPVPEVPVVVQVRAAEGGGEDADLQVPWGWWGEEAGGEG